MTMEENPEIAKEPPSLLDPQTVVKVVVGEEKSEFFVHKNFLCHYSPYFAGALREGAFTESKTQHVELNHADSEAFGLFVSWLYTQKIAAIHGSTEKSDKPSWDPLIYLWILADYLQIPALQNAAIDELISKGVRLRKHPSSMYNAVYENTASGCVLRKLFVDRVVWDCYGEKDFFVENPDTFPKDMLLELVAAYNRKECSGGIERPLDKKSNYHVSIAGGGNKVLG